ncbi:MAG: ROK family protein [Candidatus Sumerlaeia bacterium]|nr:ROK family protein [Candidatus Sumerlaeia bacterium]
MDLNLPMVSAVVQELIKLGELVEEGYATSTGGRKAQLLDVNPRRGGVVAIEFSSSGILSAAADSKGRLSNHVARRFDFSLGMNEAIRALIDAVQHQIEFLKEDEGLPLLRIGIVTNGPVDEANGVSLSINGFPGWDNVPIGPMLADEFDVPADLGSQPVAVALAETLSGAHRDLREMLVVQLGPALACCPVVGGDVYRGRLPLVGELGQVIVPGPGGEPLRLAQLASASSMVRRAGEAIAAGGASEIPNHVEDGDAITVSAIFGAGDMGDPLAQRIVDEAAEGVSVALAAVGSILAPEAILLGGTMTADGERLVARIEERTRALLNPLLGNAVRFERGSFGGQAGVAGAVAVALTAHYNTFAD